MANTLSFLGYQPVWQEIFGTESGDLRGMLRQQIDHCKGVVQLVGQCYGVEPPRSDKEFERTSYTQYEALYAQRRGKKVWYLFIDENFPTDSHEPEPPELRELQAAYRRRLQSEANVFYQLTSSDALEASVLKMRDDLVRLRRGVKQWAAAIAILLVLSVGLGLWILRGQRETALKIDQLSMDMQKLLLRGVTQYPPIDVKVRQALPNADPSVTQEEIYDELGKQLGVDPRMLRKTLPQFAERLKRAPNATSYLRANAAFVTKDYGEAEPLAIEAANQDLRAPLPDTGTWTPQGTGPPPCLPTEFVDPYTGNTWRFDYSRGQWWSYSSSGRSMLMGSGPPFPCGEMLTAKRSIPGGLPMPTLSVSRFFDPQTGNYWSYSNGQWRSYSYSTEHAIRALELAGWSAERQIRYSDALQHLREAEKLTNQRRDPEEWARIQNDIVRVIYQQGQFGNVIICEGVKIDTFGTGETIGHVADLRLVNVTDQPINCVIPPMILESKSGNNQDYVCPKGVTLKIDPHGTATVPMGGACIKRNKPPVGKGVTGDLVGNTGDSSVPPNPGSHVPTNQARDLLRLCTSKYDAADKLQKDGGLKDLPYADKQKQKDIVVQWSIWSDPRVCAIVGTPAATKDDLRKVVYKQMEGPMTPATKKEVDEGIDTVFQKVELTTAIARGLAKPE